MNLVLRAWRISVTPSTEWDVIERESTPPGRLIAGYVLPLALLGPIVAMIAVAVRNIAATGDDMYLPLETASVPIVIGILSGVVGCIVAAFVIDGFATTFHGTRNRAHAFKLAAYSFTPFAIVGVLRIIDPLGIVNLVGLLWSAYVLYVGLPKLMKAPADRALPYTATVVVLLIVMMSALMMLAGLAIITGSLFTDSPFRIV